MQKKRGKRVSGYLLGTNIIYNAIREPTGMALKIPRGQEKVVSYCGCRGGVKLFAPP